MCDRHPRFVLHRDRAVRDHADAVRVAIKRFQATGEKHRVTRHVGPFFPKGVWFVQAAHLT